MKFKYAKAFSILIITATVFYSFVSLLPSNISDESTSLTKFSTERALIHLKQITKKPHFVGTKEHKIVREYLVNQLEKLGLDVEIQEQFAINSKWKAAVNTINIIAKIKGSEPNNKALLLLSHYDSAVHSSYGASDAGSGIVTILEGVRAFLETNKTPKNDIIILFSDAEEVGLLGAEAFVKHHKWTNNVGLVLNFEARGSGGPSYMLLETNGGNKELIKAFNKAKPNFPVANSLMYSIYKMLPNDTDLTVFREKANINGFNFAFIDDHFDYHTAQDTYSRLDRNTLEQQGDYLTTMLTYFSDANLDLLNSTTDDVYFSFPKLGLVTYPFSWVLPMLISAVTLFLIFLFIGIKQKKLLVREILQGFIPFSLSLIIVSLFTNYGMRVINKWYPQYTEILHGFTYNGHWYIVFFTALTLAFLFWIYTEHFKNYDVKNLLIAPIFIWLLINLMITIKLKGAGFFIFPVFLSLFSLMVLFSSIKSEVKLIVITILSIPTLIVFVPLIKMFPVGLGLKLLPISTVFTVLLFGLLLPIFHLIKNTKKLSFLFLILGVLAFVSASLKSSYSSVRKQPTSLVYYLDADKNQAYWASYENTINEYNKAYLTTNPTKGSFTNDVTASKYFSKYKLYKQTEVIDLKTPIITKLLDTIEGSIRHIKLQIQSARNANRIEILTKNNISFKTFKINDEDANSIFYIKKRKSILTYYFTKPNEIINLEFSTPEEMKIHFEVQDVKYDLFTNTQLNVKPRKNQSFIPTPFVINDATIVKKEVKF